MSKPGTRHRPSVILIRESEEQVAGSGCCGKFEGDRARCNGEWIFPERRQLKEDVGALTRFLREEFGEAIELTVVDPRNQLYLFPKIVRDLWHYRPAVRSSLRSAGFFFSFPAVLINGAVKFSGRVPGREEIAAAVLATMPVNLHEDVRA